MTYKVSLCTFKKSNEEIKIRILIHKTIRNSKTYKVQYKRGLITLV